MKTTATITSMIGTLVLLAGAVSLTAADFDGDSRDDIAIFRPAAGMWAIRGVTRVYFGGSADTPTAGDYTGDGIAEIGIFRRAAGLWAIRGVSRIYFGGSSDTAVSGGSGQRLYDYVVRPNDGDDLENALESDTYRSIFIPTGNYIIDRVVTVDHVRKIVGEEMYGTDLAFTSGCYLEISMDRCKIEGISLTGGGVAGSRGNLYVRSNYVTVENCLSENSAGHGFQHAGGAYASFIDCLANNDANAGFQGSNSESCRFLNCAARACGSRGFEDCHNLANCFVDGYGETLIGFYDCDRLSNCFAYGCANYGFRGCNMASACSVDGGSTTTTGFRDCYHLSSCQAQNCTGALYQDNYVSDDSTNKYSCN